MISYEEYYPYGSTSYQAVRSRTETPKRYRYTGKERDTETGLYYHGARYYAPWLGRWTSCDPSGPRDDLNLYNYVNGNPVAAVDRTGLDSDNVVDQSDPYGGTSAPGGAPPQQTVPPAEPPPADAGAPPADAAPPAGASPSAGAAAPPAGAAAPPAAPPPAGAAPLPEPSSADPTAGMPTVDVAPPEAEVRRDRLLRFDLPPSEMTEDMVSSPVSYLTYSLIYNLKHHVQALVEPRMVLNSSGQMVPSPVRDKSAEFAAVVGDIAPLVLPEILPESSFGEVATTANVATDEIAGAGAGGGISRPTFLNRADPVSGTVLGTVSKSEGTFTMAGSQAPLAGRYDFVIRNGVMQIGKAHYALAQGQPVEFAGEIVFENGQIVEWTNASGHYRPSSFFAGNAGLPMDRFRPVLIPVQSGNPEIPMFRNP